MTMDRNKRQGTLARAAGDMPDGSMLETGRDAMPNGAMNEAGSSPSGLPDGAHDMPSGMMNAGNEEMPAGAMQEYAATQTSSESATRAAGHAGHCGCADAG
jgi:hypothetical protein